MNVGICTVVDKKYKDYIPLFILSAKKAFPDYKIKVFYRGDLKADNVVDGFYTDYPFEAATTSTMRFCMPSEHVVEFDYVYMTDVDMIFTKENRPLLEQHLTVMQKTGLCYENFAVQSQRYGYRMPGIHFSNKKWWDDTTERRSIYMEKLKNEGYCVDPAIDEAILYKICKESNLGISLKGHENWRWHGLHLGKYCDRKGIRRKATKITDTIEINKIIQILQDKQICEYLGSHSLFSNILYTFYEVASRK
jgi:hypothetical protein